LDISQAVEGMRVIVTGDLSITEKTNGLNSSMTKYRGKVIVIDQINRNRGNISAVGWYWNPSDLSPIEPIKIAPPVLFDPKSLI